VLSVLLGGLASAQSTWYVADVPCGGTGAVSDPFCRIQDGIDAASTGDTVLVLPAIYVENLDFLGKDISVVGTAGSETTIVDGNQAGSVVMFRTGEGPGARLAGFTLMNGSGFDDLVIPARGGGVFCIGASPRIEDCVIVSNGGQSIAYWGGGVYALDSSIALSGCTIEDNSVDLQGGGIYLENPSAASIDDCLIRDNSAEGQGGGIAVFGGSVAITSTIVSGNRASFDMGGGISLDGALATIAECEIADNDAFDDHSGGGLAVLGGTVTVVHTTLARNSGAHGGGAFVSSGQADFVACTFADNLSQSVFGALSGNGGGLFVGPGSAVTARGCVFTGNRGLEGDNGIARGGAVFGPADLFHCTLVGNETTELAGGAWGASLCNCIVWDNAPGALGGAATATASDVQGGWSGFANIDADPGFWFAESGDYRLTPGSPCIGAGLLDCSGVVLGTDMGALTFDPGYCPAPQSYCTTTVHSEGCAPPISFTGTPTLSGADDFFITADEIVAQQFGILIWSGTPDEAPFMGATLCLAAPIVRTPVQNSGGMGGACEGAFAFHFSHAYMGSQMIAVLDAVFVQYWFRDPGSSPAIGLSDALAFVVCP